MTLMCNYGWEKGERVYYYYVNERDRSRLDGKWTSMLGWAGFRGRHPVFGRELHTRPIWVVLVTKIWGTNQNDLIGVNLDQALVFGRRDLCPFCAGWLVWQVVLVVGDLLVMPWPSAWVGQVCGTEIYLRTSTGGLPSFFHILLLILPFHLLLSLLILFFLPPSATSSGGANPSLYQPYEQTTN